MELLQLRYFLESARNENFSRTAKKYNVPTTSVSASIRRLEDELGTKLFERSANRIRLSSAGDRLYAALSPALSKLDDTVSKLSNEGQDTREIRFLIRGVRRYMTESLIEFTKQYPNVPYECSFDAFNENLPDFDVIIDSALRSYPGYESIPLFKIRMCIKASEDDPMVRRKLTFSDLSEKSFVLTKKGGFSHKLLIDYAQRNGFTPKVVAACSDIECFEKLIGSGIGVGLCLEYEKEHSARITPLNVTDFKEYYTVCAFYRKKDFYGNVEHFLNFLKNWKGGSDFMKVLAP